LTAVLLTASCSLVNAFSAAGELAVSSFTVSTHRRRRQTKALELPRMERTGEKIRTRTAAMSRTGNDIASSSDLPMLLNCDASKAVCGKSGYKVGLSMVSANQLKIAPSTLIPSASVSPRVLGPIVKKLGASDDRRVTAKKRPPIRRTEATRAPAVESQTKGSSSKKKARKTKSAESSRVRQPRLRSTAFKSTSASRTSRKSSAPRSTLESRKRDPPNLQRYYKTELLTAEEEYVLGMRVKIMVKCEAVHEGLALSLERVPTIEEWAAACGYTERETSLKPADIDVKAAQSIRPAGTSTIRPNRDPNMFVGNGLAGGAGVGRGNGRAKKAPPVQLEEFWDDSEMKFSNKRGRSESYDSNATPIQPILVNRGTVRNFIDMMVRGREAKQRMIQCNMRLAVSIAKRYRNVGVNIADLVQEGSIGLARAAEKFDPKRGFKFSTYASWWIQQAVFRSIAYHSRTIRLPVHIHNLLNRVRRIRQALQQELGRAPTNEEIADKLGMPAEKYAKIIKLTRRSISLEMPKYQNNPKDVGQESEKLVLDTIDATAVVSDEHRPERSVDQRLFRSDLCEMLKILEEDERRVICSRYGLEDGMTRTVTAVAAQFRQTKSWVRSQECRALRKLRRPWYENRLREHLLAQGQNLD